MNISIITINYNNFDGLEKTIKSVFSQSYNKFEYIIIDGGSNDGSVNLLREHTNKVAYCISEKDCGIYNAMNKGIQKATGDFLIFLNSGDEFTNEKSLELCLNKITNVPGKDIYYGDMLVYKDLIIPDNTLWKHPKELDLPFFKKDTINHQSAFINKQLFKEFGLYPEAYKLASDYWLWLTSLLNNKTFEYIEFPIIKFDFSGISASDNFKAYGAERQIIWEKVVPLPVRKLVEQNEKLIADNLKYKRIANSRLIKAALAAQKFYWNLSILSTGK